MGRGEIPSLFKMSDWREEVKDYTIEYRKKFAYRPILCADGSRVWLKNYYTKYIHYGVAGALTLDPVNLSNTFIYGYHTDFIENITEAEYIVRKLSEIR